MPPVAVYRRIMDDIQAKIASGELRPGDRLPSVSALMAAYACSDTPVKNALARLQTAGVVQGQQGRGVFVTPVPDPAESTPRW